jgi:peptidoglycan hydrolase CwlO-like protein
MKGRAILVSLIIAMSLAVILPGGCEWREKAELQKTIEDQEAKIEELQHSHEETIRNLLGVLGELEECQKQLGEVKKEYELFKKARQFTPTELQKGLAELKAAREAAAKRLREEAAAEANEP